MEATPKKERRADWSKVSAVVERWKRRRGECLRWGCKRHAGKKKIYCSRHHHQAVKLRDLISYIYSMRKQRAKARGHEWTITLDNFRDWCLYTGYHLNTGRTPGSASIDRKQNAHGYHIWNIRSIPYGANSAKHQRDEGTWHCDAEGKYHFTPAEKCPF